VSEPQTILITGATGQVGSAIARLFPQALTPTRLDLDLASEASIRTYLRTTRPRWIINPAAYTAVDKAESQPALAQAINAEAPRILGEEAAALGATVLHFSTDYVFDGTKPTPYVEADPTHPLNVYGASKLAGEQALAASGAAHIILRTSWIYAATGKNFLLTILKLAAQKSELRIVADQHGAPTSAHDLANLTAHILAQNSVQPNPASGLFHATAQGETTWHGFASEALRQHSIPNAATLIPIPTAEFPTPAQRPQNSRLNCDKLASTFNFRLPQWQTSLTQVLSSMHPAD
jgi:dTDP-4-dehydrorhamnose reductase